MNSTMTAGLDPAAVAREPTQPRAKARFEAVLKEAEAMLVELGLSGFSIPALAERLGYTRGSVYAYFPTPYAILNELATRYLKELENQYVERAEQLGQMSWQGAVQDVVEQAVEYYSSHPAAQVLILGGAVTDDSYRAQELTIKRLGDLGRAVYQSKGLIMPVKPDVATLATDLAVGCFRRSVFEHGHITPEYKDAAVLAMQSFLAHYLVSDQ